ncbi:molybdopterin molybdotransferase MoeA [Marivivens sp. LCG002]|uniref:molybdopterin molybdotransferase MoeA n=1 Tax=Marivivens sp. LCG002 TaxID=3051171 RepID=UPI0025522FF9|nr:gephyrin-like molybdotransferase Glp [Marivivens sp. LCG002]WIV51912.1 molybdopterin molybdotransferase MoeA [Marivivens sp. LCG002]
MISVAEALEKLFDLAKPLDSEEVPLLDAMGRVLASDVKARRTQPPFSASAMDGYAVRGRDVKVGATFTLIGESAAGHAFAGKVPEGHAVRIFTGAPMPEGTDHVVIQEDTARDGDTITLTEKLEFDSNVRPAGGDFHEGDTLGAPRILGAADIALLAAMNIARVPVVRRPEVAIIATGDELVQPGETPAPDQIIASNNYGIAARLTQFGARVRLLPIAKDTESALRQTLLLAKGADLVITIGGASVGDYDLVGRVAEDMGLERAFYKIAMRPGKPLMAGRIDGATMIGLPGNPVSAMVCNEIFIIPYLRAVLGLGTSPVPRQIATLAAPIGANGPREHYMRGTLARGRVTVADNQDSSLLSVLAASNCLVVRAPRDPARAEGEEVEIITI